MTKFEQALADMTAIWFAGKEKTGAELREVISSIAGLTNFRHIPADRLEFIARDNEARQGIKMFS